MVPLFGNERLRFEFTGFHRGSVFHHLCGHGFGKPVGSPAGTKAVHTDAYLAAGNNEVGSAYLDDAVLNQVSVATNTLAPPTGLVILAGDQSVVLHWDPDTVTNLSGYNVYRSLSSGGPFVVQNSSLLTHLVSVISMLAMGRRIFTRSRR